MNFTFENILLGCSILLFIGIIASKTSGKTGVPVLLLFLGIGMLAGSDGIGGIYFDNYKAAESLGSISLALIIFSGGLDTKWESIKPILWRGVSLSTLSVLITALVVGVFVSWISDFSLLEGLLLGSIVSSTDAAAVFSILRTKNIGLKRNLRPTLEFESGSNDPMAYFLTIGVTGLLVNPESSIISLIPSFFIQMILGSLGGYLMGRVSLWLINHIKLENDGLYPVLTLSLAIFTFAGTNYVNGNGFLAIYIAGMVMGNNNFIHKKSLIRFYDGVAWLMQILLFITLGLLVFPKQIVPVIGIGLLVSLFLIFVARPLSVFISLLFFRMSVREKVYISWVGLRGAVPIVFATYPLLSGVNQAETMFHIVFIIVLTSVILQGTTLGVVANWLHLSVPEKLRRKSALELELADNEKNALIEVEIPPQSKAVGKTIVGLDFPKTSLIVMIKRDNGYIVPNGATEIKSGDNMLIMAADEREIDRVHQVLDIA
ncbi:potassium/proton antiporter [Rhodocytophaga aerolata]|uniref:Potassium/proton antiporter n=1 Tax=Rhodocytophaga aerolata TaxID=455078 RepID=A0ABT8RCS6_9BACT|nr:potassium/proton antiporter [Rhodocytophaga aerolata]MDO1449865.1 potassium/proton antiporter [Rhodocytophaga aerolata]